MTLKMTTILVAVALAGAAHAEGGDANAGEKAFKKCKACHVIKDDDGNIIVKGGRTGPNLYGVIGRAAGTVEDFRYGKGLVAAGEAGLTWDEASLAEYVADSTKYLRSYLDDTSVRSKMSFKLKKGGEDVAAYLATFSPVVDAEAAPASE